nr:MAG TPA: hypothetical protein [Caudoviricetes sp.]
MLYRYSFPFANCNNPPFALSISNDERFFKKSY